MRRLQEVYENSMYDPDAEAPEGSMAMDGATRGYIHLIEAGVTT